jgi:hypothetical protein
MGISSRKNRLPRKGQSLVGNRPLRGGASRFARLAVGGLLIVAGSLSGVTRGSAEGSVPTAATSKSAPAPACRIRVTVKSKTDAHPLAGVAVRLLRPDLERRFQTDAEGIALVENLPPCEHVFQVCADGYAAQTVAVGGTAPGSTADLSFALAPGGEIRGVVRDAGGRPIARVGLTLIDGWSEWTMRPPLDAVATNDQGRFQFNNLPLGKTLTVALEHGNRVLRKTVLLTADERNVTADFAFDKGPETGSILVHVTGPDHQPIANAWVSNPGSGRQGPSGGTTDAKGDCRLDDVDSLLGRYYLAVRVKGFAPDLRTFKAGTSARPNRIKVELKKGHTLRARVMLTNGQTAANARVAFGGGADPPWRGGSETRTDVNGRAALDSLSTRGVFTIDKVAGFAPLYDFPLPLDRVTETTVTMDTAAVVKGRVVDADGRPVVPCRIRVEDTDFRQGDPQVQIDPRLVLAGQLQIRPDGRFEFGDLPPGAPIKLKIMAEGYVDQTLDRVIARPDEQFKPLEIRLQKIDPRQLLTVSGKLLDARGNPVAGAELRLLTVVPGAVSRAASSIAWSPIRNDWFDHSPDCQQFLASMTDKQGEFTFPQVRAAGYGELAYWKQEIDYAREVLPLAGPAARPVKLTLKARDPARLVVEADPKVSPNGGLVMVYGDKTLVVIPPQLLRGDRQRVTFEDLPTGELTVRFNAWARGGDRDDAYGSTTERHVKLKSGETTTFRFEKP